MSTCTSSKGHGLWFVIGGSWSVLFVSCFKVRCFVIVLFRAIIDLLSLLRRFLWSFSFLSLARIKHRVPPSFDKNPLTIAISFAILKQSRVILSQAGRARYIVICVNLVFTKMIDGTEKLKIPSKFAKRAVRYNERKSVLQRNSLWITWWITWLTWWMYGTSTTFCLRHDAHLVVLSRFT